MADISKIKLLNGNTYDIKDDTARIELVNTPRTMARMYLNNVPISVSMGSDDYNVKLICGIYGVQSFMCLAQKGTGSNQSYISIIKGDPNISFDTTSDSPNIIISNTSSYSYRLRVIGL